jgi:hypothetical protein
MIGLHLYGRLIAKSGDGKLRFSIRQLLCGVAIVAALIVTFSLANRPKHFGRIVNYMSELRFSPDGTKLAVAVVRAQDAEVPGKAYRANIGHTVAILNAADFRQDTVLAHQFHEGIGPGWGSPFQAEFTFDGKYVVLIKRWHSELWDIAAGAWSNDRPEFGADGYHFYFSPAGNAVVIYKDAKVEIRQTSSNELAFQQTDWGSIRFSPDGKRFANLTHKGSVEIWDFDDRKLLCTLHEGHDVLDSVGSLEFSPDGDKIAFRCREGLRLYRMSAKSEEVLLPEFFEVTRTATGWGEKTRGGEATRGIEFTPDGNLLAAWGDYGLKFFDAKHGFHLKSSDSKARFNCFAFAPDGKTYATGDSDAAVIIWDTQTQSQLKSVVLNGWATKDADLIVETK